MRKPAGAGFRDGQDAGRQHAAVSAYKLPQPDATIGRTRGWLPDTIDQWNTQRPGRGVGGGRPRKHAE